MLNNQEELFRTIEDNIINFTKSGKSIREIATQLRISQFMVIKAGKGVLFFLNHKIKCEPTPHDGTGEAKDEDAIHLRIFHYSFNSLN